MSKLADVLREIGVKKEQEEWATAIGIAAAANGINTEQRLGGFLANTLHETTYYSSLRESLNYSPEGLMQTFPKYFTWTTAYKYGRTKEHPADQYSIAEIAYSNRMGNGHIGSGDGWKYRGGGLMHLTGRENWEDFAETIGVSVDRLQSLLISKTGAADSAATFWRIKRCNAAMDRGDIRAARIIINGGTNGMKEVSELYGRLKNLLRGVVQERPPAPRTVLPPGVSSRVVLIEEQERSQVEYLNQLQLDKARKHEP